MEGINMIKEALYMQQHLMDEYEYAYWSDLLGFLV